MIAFRRGPNLERSGVAADDLLDLFEHVGVSRIFEHLQDLSKQRRLSATRQDGEEGLDQLEGVLEADHVVDLVLDLRKRLLQQRQKIIVVLDRDLIL